MAENVHPLETLRTTLVTLIAKPGYQHPSWPAKLALVDSIYPLVHEGHIDYVPMGWLEEHRTAIEKEIGKTLEAARGSVTKHDVWVALHGDPDWRYVPLLTQEIQHWRITNGWTFTVHYGTLDYGATGEGQTLTFIAQRAWSPADFLAAIALKEGDYFAQGYDLYEAFPEDDRVAKYLVTSELRKSIEDAEVGGGYISVYLQSHVNFS